MLIETERLLKKNAKKIRKLGHRADDQFPLLFKEIQEQSQKEQSNAYLQSTVQKHFDQINKIKTIEHLYSMLLIFIKTFEFLSNQADLQVQF